MQIIHQPGYGEIDLFLNQAYSLVIQSFAKWKITLFLGLFIDVIGHLYHRKLLNNQKVYIYIYIYRVYYVFTCNMCIYAYDILVVLLLLMRE